SPREALAMDPQQRLLLETAWETLERAGIDPATLRGTPTGTFIGATYQDYGTGAPNAADGTEAHMVTGSASSVLSGRVSYLFGLEGPAVTVDTACSSSLVALHLACQSLRNGESTLALAGGVAIMANPTPFVGFSRQRALALDGRCKPFSDDADGMTLAEGVGLVLLERLSDAQRNGHTVLAVVRGSAINQDGASNGLTAPNGPSQQRVIRQALANAGVSAADVDAVEAHGTGTKLGDPIEAQALLATYGQDREQPLWLGSLKSNIGHTQAAAGIAGVIKMVMAMREGTLPRTLHTSAPSSHVDWSAGAVELLTEQVQWPETGRPRRAGVSSFGISGTNAHLILEQGPGAAAEPEPQPEATADGRVVPWLLSAQSEAALRDQAARLLAHLDTHPDLEPARTGWSLATTRARLDHRAVLLGEDRDALRNALDALATARTAPAVVRGACGDAESGPVFVFPGQGAQWWGMGRELLTTSEVFRDTVDACAQALAPHTDWSLHYVLAGDADPALLERVDVVQPALFSMMVALAALWRSYGVEPAAVVGHSQGEIAAACVAGALSLDDAAAVVALRSKALLALSGKGGMMSVATTVEQVTTLLEPWADRLSLAAVNGPASVVVSGAPDALDALQEECERQGVRARRIAVDYASHGAQVEEIRDELARLLAAVKPQPPEVPFYSTVTGERLDADTALDAEYWYTNLRQTVRLEQATKALLADGHRIFAEVSPHPVLTAAVQETAEDTGNESAVALGSLRRDEGDLKRFLTSLAEAYVRGAPADWRRAFPGLPDAPTAGAVELPTYAFQHRRYWPETGTAAESTGGGAETETDKAFWGLIESGDLDSLADELGVAAPDARSSLEAVLPTLSAWRTKSRRTSAANALRYRIDWTRLTEPGSGARTAVTGTWLAVVPAAGAHDAWVNSVLAALGTDVVRVEAGHDGLAERLRTAAADASAGFTGVLCLLGPAEERRADFASVPEGLALTLALVQALDDADLQAPLWCITRGAVSTGRDDRLTRPVQATLWGLGRVVGLEQPARWGGLVDLADTDTVDDRSAARLRAALAGLGGIDGLGGLGGEDQIAVRPSGLYARRMLHAAPLYPATPENRWWTRGTVLITGGTGGLGGRLARWLAERGAQHLVLTSRRGPQAPGADALRAELEGLRGEADAGLKVTIAACDAADREALRTLLDGLPAELPLTAVVHAAGVSEGDERAEALTLEQLDALLQSKLTAALHLHELTEGLDLDAFVMFSSGAGIWGSGGQAGYSAANAFLDALAEHRRAEGLPATSVAWGAWAEAGMATVHAVHERLSRLGVRSMEPTLAITALQQSLDEHATSVTVTDMDWGQFAPSFTATRPSPLLGDIPEVRTVLAAQEGPAEATPDGESAALRGRLEAMTDAERGRALLDVVRTEAAATLGHDTPDAIPADRAFRDVGFDSVTAIELRNRLKTATGLPLRAALVFDYPTPTALAQRLRSFLFPDTPAEERRTDDPDAQIREALASVPISRLRKAGLLDMVLSLAGDDVPGRPGEPAAPAAETTTAASIDEMDGEDLLRLLSESTNGSSGTAGPTA
ncbi:polyketide synthase, partial [Streptomyces sp. NRRL B-1568]